MTVTLGLAFAAVLARLVDVQAISGGAYARMGKSQRDQTISQPAQRGAILDRDGNVLAVSIPQSTVWADPHLVTDPAAAARALSPLLGVDEVTLRQRLTTNSEFVYLARRVDDATAAKVTALKLPGVSLLDEPTRVAPDGDLAASVVGQVGSDDTGLSGLEQQYEKALAGKPGALAVERDPAGHDIPGTLHETQSPVAGKSLVLTLDRDLQYETQRMLEDEVASSKAKSGIAIVMNPTTGEILAMANVVAGDKGQPPHDAGYNKGLIDVYEPGSVNKLVTISGALQEHAIGAQQVLSVPDHLSVAGTTFQDAEPHPVDQWTAGDVMAQSSNAGAILIAQRLGAANLDHYLNAFGLAGTTSLGFPGEASGIVPALKDWSGTSLPTLAIGYGLAVTPLQMLEAYNTIANGGVYVAPSLVKAEVDASGKRQDMAPPATNRVVSPDTAAAVTKMLTQVVQSGTGTTAEVDGYTVAGKTGTARIADASSGYKDGAYVASFAGFVPAQSPQLSAIVVLDQPQPYYGGLAAAPVFSQIAAYAVRHFQIPPTGAAAGPAGAAAAAANLALSPATRP